MKEERELKWKEENDLKVLEAGDKVAMRKYYKVSRRDNYTFPAKRGPHALCGTRAVAGEFEGQGQVGQRDGEDVGRRRLRRRWR